MKLAPYIDHTILKPSTLESDIDRVCNEAIEHSFAAVCIPPYFVNKASKILQDAESKVCSVVGFPLGYTNKPTKVESAKKVIDDGAHEVDMVINISAFLSENYAFVADEIESIRTVCGMNDRLLKVIIETCLLNQEQIIKAANLCAELEVDFVKTSTGFNGQGATLQDVKLLRSILPETIGVKASGGIKTKAQALQMIEAGASRIGTSSGIEIIKA